MLANLPSDRDWNNECLVAGDRCYHSPARQGGARLHLPAIWGPLTRPERCVCRCVCVCAFEWVWCKQQKMERMTFLSYSYKVWIVSGDSVAWAKRERPALGGWQEGRWREFTAPWHRVFPSRQLHTVTRTDPVSGSMVLEFPRKTSGSQLRPLQIRNYWNWTQKTAEWTCLKSKAGEGGGYRCRERREGVNFRSGVCQNLLQPKWCISAGDCSRQVKLWTWLPFPQCVGTF